MSLTDHIGDMIARIRNGQMRSHVKIEMPASSFKGKILEVLKREGFILNYTLDQNMNTNIFYQKCFYKNRENYSQLNSVGVGFDLKNNSRIIYLQYFIGISENQSFNFENSKIHVGLKNTF